MSFVKSVDALGDWLIHDVVGANVGNAFSWAVSKVEYVGMGAAGLVTSTATGLGLATVSLASFSSSQDFGVTPTETEPVTAPACEHEVSLEALGTFATPTVGDCTKTTDVGHFV